MVFNFEVIPPPLINNSIDSLSLTSPSHPHLIDSNNSASTLSPPLHH